jgi:hypothetical protein
MKVRQRRTRGCNTKARLLRFAQNDSGSARVSGPCAAFRVTMVAAALLLTSCGSPEASRTRGGGPGADVKNWGDPIELHAGAQPYYDTPCVTEGVECHGPPAVFGPSPPPD